MSQNRKWKRKLEKKYPAEVLLSYVFNKKIPENMRSSFCQLAMQLYLCQDPFYEVQMPELCRVTSCSAAEDPNDASLDDVKEEHSQISSMRRSKYSENISTMVEVLIRNLDVYLNRIREDIERQLAQRDRRGQSGFSARI